jgi:5'-nucleotidase
MKPILYIDLDGVCADYDKAKLLLNDPNHDPHEGKVPEGFFCGLEIVDGAVEALKELSDYYDLYFLSTPQWSNPSCWMEKRIWVEEKFGELMFKKLILTHNKGLLKGDYLIDDRTTNGVESFEGKHIHFGSDEFPTWQEVKEYLIALESIRVFKNLVASL